ncbi:MAG: hypothetical protein AM1032_000198 [Mycoplasmataceae bacterium]|nr:MAG: hypothetical protein AM1032_000198 [Mycoplasmataceae bacterium]
MIEIDIVDDNNINEKNFRYFKEKIILIIRNLLIMISLLSIFSSKNENIDGEILKCSNKEEIIDVSKAFVDFINKDKVQNKIENINNINEEFEIEELKKKYIEEIKKILDKEKYNFENLDIHFNKKDKIWEETKTLNLIFSNPKKFFIINPLSKISEITKKIIFKNELSENKFFFLDLILKIIILNIISISIIDESLNGKKIEENLLKDEVFELIKSQFENMLISFSLGFFLFSEKSFTIMKPPKFINEIPLIIWSILTTIFLNSIPYLVEKEIKEGIRKDNKDEIISNLKNSSLLTIIFLLIFNKKISKTANFISLINSIVSSFFKIVIHLFKTKWKKKDEEIQEIL